MQIRTTGSLAAAVRGRRIDLGLSQADAARQAGVSRPWLSHVEGGKPTVELGRILRLLDALGLALQLDVARDQDPTADLDVLLDEYENQ